MLGRTAVGKGTDRAHLPLVSCGCPGWDPLDKSVPPFLTGEGDPGRSLSTLSSQARRRGLLMAGTFPLASLLSSDHAAKKGAKP